MFGIASYLAIAMTVAVGLFLLAEWVREPGARAPDHPGRVALVAGLLWPLVLIGLAQCALVVAAHNTSTVQSPPHRRIRVGATAESP